MENQYMKLNNQKFYKPKLNEFAFVDYNFKKSFNQSK